MLHCSHFTTEKLPRKPLSTDKPPYGSHLFMLRVWMDESKAAPRRWHAKVQHVPSGETRYFREWAALRNFLSASLAARADGKDPADAIDDATDH